MIKGGGVSLNKAKLEDPDARPEVRLLQDKYILAQKGRKNYYLFIVG